MPAIAATFTGSRPGPAAWSPAALALGPALAAAWRGLARHPTATR